MFLVLRLGLILSKHFTRSGKKTLKFRNFDGHSQPHIHQINSHCVHEPSRPARSSHGDLSRVVCELAVSGNVRAKNTALHVHGRAWTVRPSQ